ncbi:uncharacterized protein BP01DRAFT_84089 [Aspergillus saccharolyticus JOP 1030-1]|uniref:Uncharacterized protein n=1 Tax=Aspergillus saccharolyticus JOP 1030-1 TaxID=1450539 RepID=A0A318ZAN0_9EURO|nr:hypothetical protein BP01DRAFT_84089 [Aspergillus saccharolyticus JOP 1030-1]PYH44495.1 hypothetical protein BP01DRAFT_84089 [Aspergillus saccharolyticus JOP 1030-1]
MPCRSPLLHAMPISAATSASSDYYSCFRDIVLSNSRQRQTLSSFFLAVDVTFSHPRLVMLLVVRAHNYIVCIAHKRGQKLAN